MENVVEKVECKDCGKILDEEDESCPGCGSNKKIYHRHMKIPVNVGISVATHVATKRGPEGQNFIRFIFLFLIGLLYVSVNMIPTDYWYYRIILFIVFIPILTLITFRNAKFQELIFRLKFKLEDWIKIQ